MRKHISPIAVVLSMIVAFTVAKLLKASLGQVGGYLVGIGVSAVLFAVLQRLLIRPPVQSGRDDRP